MPKVPIPIADGFYVSSSLPISAQQCVNYYPNEPQTDSVTDANLFDTPGLTLAIDKTNLLDITRGEHTLNARPFFVIGNTLWRIDLTVAVDGTETFAAVSIGTVVGEDRVSIDDNGDQLCIVARPDSVTAGKTYIYDEPTTTFAEVTDANFDGPASNVIYLDGFFVFSKDSGTKFFNSPLKDGRGSPGGGPAYDALDFSQAEADPDDIRSLASSRSQLYVLGSITTEIFRNTGRSPAPFIRMQGAVLDVGISAIDSIQSLSGGIAFVGNTFNETPAVWLVRGSQKQKISTTAIDNELSDLTEAQVAALSSWYYAESGHFFYGVTFPNTTLVYDLMTKRWHERQSVSGTDLTQYRVSGMTTAYGRVMVGDLQDGKIGFIDESAFTDYGFLQRRFIVSKAFDSFGRAISVSMLEAVVEAGVGLTKDVTIQSGTTSLGIPINVEGGFDPVITLSWSDDGGRTFVGLLSRSMGKLGEYTERPIWWKLGRFPRSRIIKLEVSSPTKSTLIKVEADISG